MDTDEKLTELKKAYADMILNTAKEAAGRIIMSERKAHRLELELKESQENALQMLMKLKQTMDSKIFEAEMVSITQQKRIEELEAQLQEAEDIAKDLREELSSIQTKPQNALISDSIPTSDVRNQNSKSQIFNTSIFPFRKSYIHDQDLPSIISRNKGRKLFRSGYTHRVHACEGTLCEKLHKRPSDLVDERKVDRQIVSPKKEGYDESIDQGLIKVSDVYRRLTREMTELPLDSEPPVIQTTGGKVIKYTFQRRGKCGTLTTTPEKSTQEETEKVKSMEESTHGENEKVILKEKSTQEEKIFVEQLIALSAM